MNIDRRSLHGNCAQLTQVGRSTRMRRWSWVTDTRKATRGLKMDRKLLSKVLREIREGLSSVLLGVALTMFRQLRTRN